jgi:hypothetical protein
MLSWHLLPRTKHIGQERAGHAVYRSSQHDHPPARGSGNVMIMVAAQLSLSVVLDHFGLLGTVVRPLDLARLAGMALLF